jgi:hypothetical protein
MGTELWYIGVFLHRSGVRAGVELKSVESLGHPRYKVVLDEEEFVVTYTENSKILGLAGESAFFRKLESVDVPETKAATSEIFQRIKWILETPAK